MCLQKKETVNASDLIMVKKNMLRSVYYVKAVHELGMDLSNYMVVLDGSFMNYSNCVKYLGFTFDSCLSKATLTM